MRAFAALAVLVALTIVAARAVASTAAAPANTRICGPQIQGPHASYLSNVSGLRSDGSTWTIIATAVDCTFARKHAPGLLGQWAKAKIGASLKLSGWSCLKMVDHGYTGHGTASGGFMCHKGSSLPVRVFGQNTFAVRETSPYTIGQIKAFFGIR